MTSQDWEFVFVKVGHYVASKSTRFGESIVLCSDFENLPARYDSNSEQKEEKIHARNQNWKSGAGPVLI